MSEQSDTGPFAFSAATTILAKAIVAKYPAGRQQSAVMPLLDLAQRRLDGRLSQAAIEYVAQYLGMPRIRVMEVVSFYTMYNTGPVGRHLVQVCTTTPCWLRGSDAIVAACEAHLGVTCGETTADGAFTLREVECLGACVNAPMMQIGDDYYEDLDPQSVVRVLKALGQGEAPPAGSQSGRQTSAPAGGPTTLTTLGSPGVAGE